MSLCSLFRTLVGNRSYHRAGKQTEKIQLRLLLLSDLVCCVCSLKLFDSLSAYIDNRANLLEFNGHYCYSLDVRYGFFRVFNWILI